MKWHKVNRRIAIYLVVSIQILFLFMILKENVHSNLICGAIVLISGGLLIAHNRVQMHHEDHFYEHVLVAVWIPVGAMLAYYLNINLHLGPVLAAGIVGTAGSFIPEVYKRSAYLKQLPPAIYCGAFIGMSSVRVANGFLFVIAASVFAGVLLVLSKSLFMGMGGKLGVLAFSGVAIASFLLFIVSHYAY